MFCLATSDFPRAGCELVFRAPLGAGLFISFSRLRAWDLPIWFSSRKGKPPPKAIILRTSGFSRSPRSTSRRISLFEGWDGICRAGLGQLRSSSMRMVNIITLLLVIVGAVNWGLVGLFQFDLVAALFGGQQAALSRIVYVLVGLSGLYQLVPLISALSSGAENPQLATRSHR